MNSPTITVVNKKRNIRLLMMMQGGHPLPKDSILDRLSAMITLSDRSDNRKERTPKFSDERSNRSSRFEPKYLNQPTSNKDSHVSISKKNADSFSKPRDEEEEAKLRARHTLLRDHLLKKILSSKESQQLPVVKYPSRLSQLTERPQTMKRSPHSIFDSKHEVRRADQTSGNHEGNIFGKTDKRWLGERKRTTFGLNTGESRSREQIIFEQAVGNSKSLDKVDPRLSEIREIVKKKEGSLRIEIRAEKPESRNKDERFAQILRKFYVKNTDVPNKSEATRQKAKMRLTQESSGRGMLYTLG